MDLRPAHENPYSSLANAIEKLEEKGYNRKYSVRDEVTIEDEDGNSLNADQLSIDELIRFEDRENKSENTMVVAINSEDGSRGVITTHYGKDGNQTVDRFLQNLDKGDQTHKNY